jgi:hypothetical protein
LQNKSPQKGKRPPVKSKAEKQEEEKKRKKLTTDMRIRLDFYLEKVEKDYAELCIAIKEQSNDYWRLKVSNLVC